MKTVIDGNACVLKQLTTSRISCMLFLFTFLIACKEEEFSIPSTLQFLEGRRTTQWNSGETINLVLDLPVSEQGSFEINISSDATYGVEYTTIPPAISNTISMQVARGQSSAQFVVQTTDSSLNRADRTLLFNVVRPSPNIKIGKRYVFSLTVAGRNSAPFGSEPPRVSYDVNRYTDPDSECDFFSYNCYTSAPISEGFINESQTEGIVVPILLSGPAKSDGWIKLMAQSQLLTYCGSTTTYDVVYTTDPPAQNGIITLPVAAGSTNVSFMIFPIDNNQYTAAESSNATSINFGLAGMSQDLEIGESSNYSLYITENEIPSLANIRAYTTIFENDSNGEIIEIPLSEVTRGPSTLFIPMDGYGYFYVTDPPAQPAPDSPEVYLLTLQVPTQSTSVQFRVIPMHNASCADAYNSLSITSCGFVKTAPTFGYNLYVVNTDETSTASFEKPGATDVENNPEGMTISMLLSEPAHEDGFLGVLVSDDGERYTSSHPLQVWSDVGYTSYYIEVPFSKGATTAQFTINAIDNKEHNGDYTIEFTLLPNRANCVIADDETFKLVIRDDD
jgi:hypothetical protein